MNQPTGADPQLTNADLAPTQPAQRTWTWRSFAALWVGMVVCVPTYTLAGGLVSTGLSAWQAVGLVFLGNLIVLVPMLIVGHAGARFGLPFPVLLRSAFGPRGAQLPALARALVACGWFGINTWLGGSAIYAALNIVTHDALAGPALPLLAINLAQLLCFLAFWALHIWFIVKGTESIRWLETWSAPFLLVMGLALLAWAWRKAGGFGPMLAAPATIAPDQLWGAMAGGLTAMVGFWATMALNICDFTRFARSQRDQIIGQAIGLPIPMALFAFIGVAVTSATVALYGEPIWNPIDLAAKMGGMGVVLSLFVLLIATITTNLAANVVSPAYDFSNLAPAKISFVQGGLITAGLGIAIFPWRLMESAGTYLFAWLGGYGALLGPIAGILVCDYLWVRRGRYDVPDLFRFNGRYRGAQGWNLAGVTALAVGVAPNLPGFLHTVGLADPPAVFDSLFQWAWFIGFGLAALIYGLLMHPLRQTTPAP
ncbi:NCS1 family nucleobase:cation symporter-1 [Caulobacter ginsengisoli]|uniref:NCS1 family nucleobase:cation symporter-1 n=1 Tax=Caulobacter ginsengisoli TaxID=400775 RepID=A0ABU0IQA5_9CAUL|nr:NCS1 family nucleobase:cation symporter-1 [Caulobacter ginsengisoli]MDQ0464149.1 NCS1 family nucleobase:cation symporter-1 [Caulobacter ginsengisoli]